MIREDQVRTGTPEAEQGFQHHTALFNPPLLCRRLHHGVFATHVVGRNGQAAFRTQLGNDIEIGQAWLHHQDVGAFVFVHLCLEQRLPAVRRVHLVGVLVGRYRLAGGGARCRVQCRAERTIVGRGVLGGVGDDAHLRKTLVVERVANGLHPAVHHVAGTNQIGTAPRLGHRLLAEHLNSFVVQHHALLAHDAVVAVGGIGIEGNVRHHGDARMVLLDAANGAGDQATFVAALGAVFALQFGGHLREQHHATNPQVPGTPHLVAQGVEAPAVAARHCRNGIVPCSLLHKERVDELRRCKACLAHHGPEGFCAPEPARPVEDVEHLKTRSPRSYRSSLELLTQPRSEDGVLGRGAPR